MHINFFNFSNLFVPYILWLFFKGHGEKLFGKVLSKKGYNQWFMQRYEQWFMQRYEQWFMQRYEQWFMQRYEQWFWYNPDRYSGQIFLTLLI